MSCESQRDDAPEPIIKAFRVYMDDEDTASIVFATSFGAAVVKFCHRHQISEDEVQAVFLLEEDAIQ